jgi:putative hydrolase
MLPTLLEDCHVHSTFSDGKHTVGENIEEARGRGLTRLVCVDHVRRSSDWLSVFVAEVKSASRGATLEVRAGIEAKLLNTEGDIDAPFDWAGVDDVYVADHQVPTPRGAQLPSAVVKLMANGQVTSDTVVQWVVDSYLGCLRRFPRVVLAHAFSVLPKLGLSETDLTEIQIEQLVGALIRHKGEIELDERWRAPGLRLSEACHVGGVAIRSSSDSHSKEHIARYAWLAPTIAELRRRQEARGAR